MIRINLNILGGRTCVCVSGGTKRLFFGKFEVLCFLVTPALRFAFYPYCWRIAHAFLPLLIKNEVWNKFLAFPVRNLVHSRLIKSFLFPGFFSQSISLSIFWSTLLTWTLREISPSPRVSLVVLTISKFSINWLILAVVFRNRFLAATFTQPR